MRLKLDENLGRSVAEQFRRAGHDTATVWDQQLSGAPDDALFRACVEEGRALVTLDLDFGDPFRFDPAPSAGIAVMRVPNQPGRNDLLAVAARLIDALAVGEVKGRLWVVNEHRVRQYEPPEE